MEALTCEPVKLDHHGSRDHHRLFSRLEQERTGGVILVRSIHGRIERTSVADQRHDRGP